ncbi:MULTISPECIES: hypothetical protein [unclassified Agarivorans]|uniref:hypothetical protein n=1 Tax=unclassified Agarivorans TaxID=2636026 RepID=UPI0026E218C8|nr:MULTISPECIES: hypothetical protein [unclassified Agarivorans]MDO6687237.1 hypothetical protein [Agarivorans sp. 3_MG-2023]MDO6716836.1 hypothetical protein [Agarivorans sp. 2_MG-2023]
MTLDKLFELFEKTYFHEMEVREKLIGRVQLNFALLAAVLSFVSYMVRMVDFEQKTVVIITFFILISLIIILSFFCLKHLLKAFWGNEYKGMPSPIETDDFRDELLKHKGSIDEYNTKYPDNLQEVVVINDSMKTYLYEHYRDCATHNTIINDTRSSHIHHSFKWLLFLAIPFVLSSIVFISGNLDVSSPRKETPIADKSASKNLQDINKNLVILNKSLVTFSKSVNESVTNPDANKLLVSELLEISNNLSSINETLKGNKLMSNNQTPPPPVKPSQPPARKVIENNAPKPKM